MPIRPEVEKRLSDLETRVKALELTRTLARIDDQPASVQNAFAIRRVLELARPLAKAHLQSNSPEEREWCGEILDWLDVM